MSSFVRDENKGRLQTLPIFTKNSNLHHIWKARWKARTDLLWLCHNILDFTLVDKVVHGPMIASLQQFPLPDEEVRYKTDTWTGKTWSYTPWCNPYKDLPGGRRRLLLFSRGYYKTSCNTIAHTVQTLLNMPHLAMALLFSTDKKAQDILSQGIRDQFRYNQKLRELFPDYCPKTRISDWGNAESFTLANRNDVLERMRLPQRVEPSVMSQSIDKSQAGYHFDWIKGSDLVEANNCTTPQQRALIQNRVGLLPNLLVKRPDGLPGWIDIEGTFYHPEDLHMTMIKEWLEQEAGKKDWDVFVRGVFQRDYSHVPEGYVRYTPNDLSLPWFLDPNGKRVPTWASAESIEKLEQEEKSVLYGGFTFACTPGKAKILMSNWSEREIQNVQIGDEIVGFGKRGRRNYLRPTKVLDKGCLKNQQVYEIKLRSGHKIYSTNKHLWLTTRIPDEKHAAFLPPKLGRRLIRVYTPPPEENSIEQIKTWAYLGGLLDGEGHIDKPSPIESRSNITITQSIVQNPHVCKKIEETLNKLGIIYNVYKRDNSKIPNWTDSHMYWLKGGRSLKIRMLKNMDFAKKPFLEEHLWGIVGRLSDGMPRHLYTKNTRGGDPIVAIREHSVEDVYWLTTETGNYISQGYASKNSQRALDLKSDTSGMRPFPGAIRWKSKADMAKVPIVYRLTTVDLADTVSIKSNNSVITTAGIDRMGRVYVEEILRGKWGPDEVLDKIFDVFARKKPLKVVVEDYAYVHGLKPSIERKQAQKMCYPPWHFQTPDRTTKKINRIVNTLQTPFATGDLWFLEDLVPDPEENRKLKLVIENEFHDCTLFSPGASDDVLDTLSYLFLARDWFGAEMGAESAYLLDKAVVEKAQNDQYAKARKEMIWGPEGAVWETPFTVRESRTGW